MCIKPFRDDMDEVNNLLSSNSRKSEVLYIYLQLLNFEVISKNYFKIVKIRLYSVTIKD